MKVYHIKRRQELSLSQQEAWDFFSSPHNLVKITPPNMNFRIEYQAGGEKMFAGQIICYHVNVLPFWPVRWVTEITHVQSPSYFVDEQRSGPYRLWHHCHWFHQTNNGVEVVDEISYSIPFGILGRLANVLFVRRSLDVIFEYRFKTLEKLFNPDSSVRKSA